MLFVYQMRALLLAAFPPWNVGGAAAMAQSGGLNQAGFEMYLPQLRAKALADGVSRSTVDRVFPTLQFSSRTVELDRGQPGGTAGSPAIPPFAPYPPRHVTPSLVSRGQDRHAGPIRRPNEVEEHTAE